MFSIPDEKGKIIQYNDGDNVGNVMTTFGMDFDTIGKVKVSETTKVFFDQVSEAEFSNKILGFIPFGSDKIVAFGGGDVYNFTIDTYTSYSRSSSISPTDTANPDGCFFDGLILVATTTTINSSPDASSWTNWWGTTLGQAPLSASSSTEPRLLKVGSDGNLYISDNGNKIYRVTPTGAISLSGAGTLDFSATNHLFTCMEVSSNRLWIGTQNIGGEAIVIEWDMSPNAPTANKLHRIGAEAVRMIVIEDDVPVAILSNGNVKRFNGVQFTDYEIMNIRVPEGYKLASNFVHRNGWDLIDEKPHIAISGLISITTGKYEAAANSTWLMPSGIYCMDKEKGLYLRYTFGSGDVVRTDYAQVAVTDIGALKAVNGLEGKFLVSYETMLTNNTYNPTLSYENAESTYPVKAWLLSNFSMTLRQLLKTLEIFHKPLETGMSIKLYTRNENTNSVTLKGAWLDNKTFNTEITGTNIEKGNLALIKMGNGAGQWLRVESIGESGTVTTLTLEEENTFASAGNYGTLEVVDFKYMGIINDTTQDAHVFNIPETTKKRKRQFLLEFTKPVGKKFDVDYIIAN